MGFIKSNGTGLKGVTVTDPREIFTNILKASSGSNLERTMRYSIFYQFVAFKGVKDGIGTSTIVANTALAMARLGLNVCVVDTSILNPCQDILLKTNYQKTDKDIVDWFDMGFTRKSVLNISSIDRKVSVLSFQNRNIIDMLSTSDSASLVELAFSQLATKFDIVLIDLCHEPTNITTTCLQLSHKMIQVWSNGEAVLRNVENFVKNNIICSCSMDKMRYVVTSMTVDDVPTNWEELLKKYHFKHLGHIGMSMEIAQYIASGQKLFNAASKSAAVQEFNDCITDILCHLLNISADTNKISTADAYSIEEGRSDTAIQTKSAEELADYPERGTISEAQPQGTSYSEDDYMKDFEEHGDDLDLFDDESEVKPKKGFFGRGGKG